MNFIFVLFITTYPWPIRPFTGPHPVSATLGDARGNAANPRFHRGIDIPTDSGTSVFSLISGRVRRITTPPYDGIYVGNYWYIHLKNMLDDGTQVRGIIDSGNVHPTRIGEVRDYGASGPSQDHLHFQIGPPGPPEGPFFNPLTYTINNTVGPDNYTDNGIPLVWGSTQDFWWFWREGSEGLEAFQVGSISNGRIVIYGKIDIRVRCQDRLTSAGSEQTSGIYKIKWGVLRMGEGLQIPFTSTIRFQQVQPPNNGGEVLLVYDRHNYQDHSPFFYWITNPIINNQVEDRYWNTKLRRNENWNGGNARINSEAQYPDGIYKIWVLAYDTSIAGSNGGDTINRRGAEDEIVVIDNFSPYITQVLISNKYSAYWGEIIDSLNLGDLNVNREDFKQDELQNLNIILSFSEIMNTNYNPEISLYFESSKNEYRLDLEQGNWNNTGTIFNGNFRLNQNLNENDTGFVTLKIRNVRDLANNTLDSNPKTIEFYENFYL
jgi:hypothetical protein